MPAKNTPFKKAYFYAHQKKYRENQKTENSELKLRPLSKDFATEHMESLCALYETIPRTAFDLDSPNRFLPHLFGDKWTPLIMMIISTGTIRYALLKRTVTVFSGGEEISKFMLTKKLRELERNGLLVRHQTDDTPPKVDYTLTEIGYDILAQLIELFGLIYSHTEEITCARTKYDEKIRGQVQY